MPFADGQSLLPLWENPSRHDWTDQILCACYGGEFLYAQRMAITDRYKYMFNGFAFDEMYDLKNDPDEMRNLAGDANYRKEAGEMRARIYTMMRQYNDPYAGSGPPVHGGEPPGRYGAMRYLPQD